MHEQIRLTRIRIFAAIRKHTQKFELIQVVMGMNMQLLTLLNQMIMSMGQRKPSCMKRCRCHIRIITEQLRYFSQDDKNVTPVDLLEALEFVGPPYLNQESYPDLSSSWIFETYSRRSQLHQLWQHLFA